ncbi:MAG: VCBS repeat-containing protein [Gammaproteobacteria bacterium]|nr:VCBS repeat-containing protein [Gammaproteobacteria bacterium]
MIRVLGICILMVGLLVSCDSDFTTPDVVLVDLGIDPVTTENMNTSYHHSKPVLSSMLPLVIDYAADLPSGPPGYDATRPDKAIAYFDINGDTFLDIYLSTGINLTADPYFDNIFLNDGASNFSYDVTAFLDDSDPQISNEPLALNASKALVSDFNVNPVPDTTGNWLDVFILDQGTAGAAPKLVLHKARHTDPADTSTPLIHWFTHQIYNQDAGYHTTGASADIDNDGDADVFVGGLEPFFYINTGAGGFIRVNNRWDRSMNKVLAAELVDIDLDGYVDLIVGGDEADGDVTSIYWGNSTGTYIDDHRTQLPVHAGYGVILDFEVENLDADSNRDIVIYRTSATDADRVVQLIKNNGARNFAINTSFTVATGAAWLRAQDNNNDGDVDIFPDNAATLFWFENDGAGNFTQH